jgi:hypothetical protein
VGDPSFQEHDFEPGIASNGLFWTIAISRRSLEVDPGTGRARLRGQGLAVTDHHDIVNAIFGGGPTPVPAHVSFDVRWSGDGHRQRIRDATFGFVGQYVAGPATISFTAQDDAGNVLFSSDPEGQYNPTPDQGGAGSPAVGHERNGVFFP